jgi:2-keto-4-pentenoate hydratase/2-oxohepta-3-ene-1,7-dioic acid hydratase in catechol pathway
MNDSPMLLPRLRRTLNRAERRIDVHIDTGDGWRPADETDGATRTFPITQAFTAGFELARYDNLDLADGATVLPICPASFRDFMVYEKHAVDAARGMARRFVPAGYRIGRAYEAITRRTFPAFAPHSLWYRQPVYYMSNALTIVPSGVPIAFPSYSRALDFELELGVVLGTPLRDATVDQANAAIEAVVVVSDFSARDV